MYGFFIQFVQAHRDPIANGVPTNVSNPDRWFSGSHAAFSGVVEQRGRGQTVAVWLTCLACVGLFFGCDRKDIAGSRCEAVFGGRGIGPGQFVYPRAIAVGPDGGVFVVDKTARIQRFSPDGEFEAQWQMPESAAGKPTGLSVDRLGRVFVADTHYHRVIVYDRDGRELARFGTGGEGPGEFILPTTVEVAEDGTVFVAEYGGNDRINRFSPDFKYIDSIGGKSDPGNQFLRPQGLAIDHDASLWIADACRHRICHLDDTGRLISSFGEPGRGQGQLQYPYDLVLLADETLLVCEFGNNRLQRFDRTGKSLGTWGTLGTQPGQLCSPWGVALGKDGRIYVLDSRNDRVQIIRM